MSTDEYVPSEGDVRDAYRAGRDVLGLDFGEGGDERADAEFDRFLARVRRDALTALADHWDETVSEHAGRPLFSASGTHVRHYRDTHYPEETP